MAAQKNIRWGLTTTCAPRCQPPRRYSYHGRHGANGGGEQVGTNAPQETQRTAPAFFTAFGNEEEALTRHRRRPPRTPSPVSWAGRRPANCAGGRLWPRPTRWCVRCVARPCLPYPLLAAMRHVPCPVGNPPLVVRAFRAVCCRTTLHTAHASSRAVHTASRLSMCPYINARK